MCQLVDGLSQGISYLGEELLNGGILLLQDEVVIFLRGGFQHFRIAFCGVEKMDRIAPEHILGKIVAVANICFRICAYHFSGFDYFRLPGLYQQICAEDLRLFLQKTVTPQRLCMAVIYPKEEETL